MSVEMMQSEKEIFGPALFFVDLQVFDLLTAASFSFEGDRYPYLSDRTFDTVTIDISESACEQGVVQQNHRVGIKKTGEKPSPWDKTRLIIADAHFDSRLITVLYHRGGVGSKKELSPFSRIKRKIDQIPFLSTLIKSVAQLFAASACLRSYGFNPESLVQDSG
jgi:hypothetical protein